VFASGNMVKRLVGLGVFQTSVFLFYISMGKVTGGIPPILPESHGAGETHAPVAEAGVGVEHAAENVIPEGLRGSRHEAAAGPIEAPSHQELVDAGAVNETVAGPIGGDVHGAALDAGGASVSAVGVGAGTTEPHAAVDPLVSMDGASFAASALDQTYSNPLPHVLILTAIVVGVATLAVGLALVVLIREAYGTIEDDDISRAEYDAEVMGADA